MLYVNDEPEGKFLYTDTIKLYCIEKDVMKNASVTMLCYAEGCLKGCTK